ncbi:hypothetical protein C8Q74DRAFT_1374096 [Fomes fomentarius]|nr:hypothetical protein C8Q74DRAFT_1374096 [Fomes fomentarius]
MTTDVLEPALLWDILREIAFICPRGTCTTLMRTCTFFYHEVAASILSHEILLHNESITTSFLEFLHAGKNQMPRYPLVRHLALRLSLSLSPDTAKGLADAIALMTGLVTVQIPREIGNFWPTLSDFTIGNWPALSDAIASLPSLQRIFIHGAGPQSCQFLLSLQSANLRSIDLDITDRELKEELSGQRLSAPWLSSHLVQFFGRWTSTLTELRYHTPFLPAAQYTPSYYPEAYPMMRTLSICHRGRVDPSPYIRAFPILAHLDVHMQSELNDLFMWHEYRTSNVLSQREVQRLGPASQHPGQWWEFVQFNGTLADLYALALNCRISHIRLDFMEDTHLPLLSASPCRRTTNTSEYLFFRGADR